MLMHSNALCTSGFSINKRSLQNKLLNYPNVIS